VASSSSSSSPPPLFYAKGGETKTKMADSRRKEMINKTK
jgi:hypothetical protein